MRCRYRIIRLALLLFCLVLLAVPARAAESELEASDSVYASEADELAAIQAELDAENADHSTPSIPAYAGAVGLVVLLVFGMLTSRHSRRGEEQGYDSLFDHRRIGTPYDRLRPQRRKRRSRHS